MTIQDQYKDIERLREKARKAVDVWIHNAFIDGFAHGYKAGAKQKYCPERIEPSSDHDKEQPVD